MLSFREAKKRLKFKEKLLNEHLKNKDKKTSEYVKERDEPRGVAVDVGETEKRILEEQVKDLEVWNSGHVRGGSFSSDLGLSSENYKRGQEIKKNGCPEKGCELGNDHGGYHTK